MDFPNGTVITPDGTTLIVADVSCRLTAFDIAANGTLSTGEFGRRWIHLHRRHVP